MPATPPGSRTTALLETFEQAEARVERAMLTAPSVNPDRDNRAVHVAECRVMLDIIRASQQLGHQEPRTVLREVLRVLLTLQNATLSQAAPRN